MSRRGLALFILLSVLWGVPYLLIKLAVAEVSVPFLVFARSALGAAVLLPFAMRGPGIASVKAHWRPVLAFALVEMVVPWGLIVHSEVRLSSSTAGLLVAATPIITVALSRFRRDHERLGAGRIAGLTLGLAGVVALAVPELGGDLVSGCRDSNAMAARTVRDCIVWEGKGMGCESCGPKGRDRQASTLAMPPVTNQAEWQRARDQLLVKEKAVTRQLDALAAERRRLPMVIVPKDYAFEGAGGATSLGGLFEGRRQLIVYHFMYGPDWESACPGCSRRMDDVGHLALLHARQTTFTVVARAPYERLRALWQRKGWTMPVYSSGGGDFNSDMGVTVDGDEDFGLSVFFRDDAGTVYRSYFTNGRGVEPAGFRHLLDMTPYGRQEEWEDSPAGWPQSPTHGWRSERDE